MLYVTTMKNGESRVIRWHIGENLSDLLSADQIHDVVSAMADCDEMDHIVARFVNLPYTLTAVNQWFGDQAKQIVSWLSD